MTHTWVQHVLYFFPKVRDSTKFLFAAAHTEYERYIFLNIRF